MSNEDVLSIISALPNKVKKELLKSITDLHETAYRRGFQQGAAYMENYNFNPPITNEQKYSKIIDWRYSRRKVANSPIHPGKPFETLQDIMLHYASRFIVALTGHNDLLKIKLIYLGLNDGE